ncbi:MAG TPA: hypothetical protein VJ801_14225 [Polyangia bacterium]|jgi:hypothetical protein|nr:hypothetical protein [Polyangia bacterium]
MRVPSQPLPLGPSDGKLTGREWWVLVLGALTLTVLVCLVEPSIFGSMDWVHMHGLYKGYVQTAVSHGRLPLWNPHHWLGRPFLADIESAFFYPSEWVYFFLDIHVACALTCAIHYLLCLYGTLRLARALGTEKLVSFFVAFVFASSASIVGCFTSGLVHYGQALCYTPLILYLGMRLQATPSRRDVALLGLTLGLEVLCGHPQAAWISEVGLAVFLVGRRLGWPLLPSLVRLGRDLGLAGVALALGLGLAAVALLPLAELAGQGNRPAASVAFAAVFSEPLYGWATLIVPTELPFFGFQATGKMYAGLVAFLAGVCGLTTLRDRNVRALLWVAIFAVLLAAGEQTPVFRFFFHTVPGVGWLRIHARATVLVTLALVLAAGLFLSRPPSRKDAALVAGLTLGALIFSVGFCLTWSGYGAAASAIALRRVLVVLVAGSLVVLWKRVESRSRLASVVGALLLLVTVADLGFAGHALKQEDRETPEDEVERLLQLALEKQGLLYPGGAPPRVFLPTFRENAGMAWGWSTPHGYSALAPGRVWKHMHDVLGVPVPTDRNTFPSLSLAAYGPFPYDSMALVAGADPRTRHPVIRRTPDPRAYLAGSARRVRDADRATALMRAGHDFHHIALVEQALALPDRPDSSLDPDHVRDRATIVRFEPERILVATESSVPALLVLAEPWFPGWSALVNGAPAACIPANAWMRAVLVPAGKSQVVLTFHSTYLASGAAISLAALALILGLLLLRRQLRLPLRGFGR